MTAEELWNLPDTDDRLDLIDGTLHRSPPMGGDAGYLTVRVGSCVVGHAGRSNAGQTYAGSGYILARDPDTVLTPDVSFVRSEHVVPPDQHRKYLPQAPDLAVEIKSPDNSHPEMERIAYI